MNRLFYLQKLGTLGGHNGADMVGDGPHGGYGEPVKAMHSGRVIAAKQGHKTMGNAVYLLDTSNKFYSVYMHMSRLNVIEGQHVVEGATIGFIGNAGLVSPKPTSSNPKAGTHLHVSFRQFPTGIYFDPIPMLHREGDRYPYKLTSLLFLGSTGDEVSYLQTLLKLEKPAITFQPVGIFGYQTTKEVNELQVRNGLVRWLGSGGTGPLTRNLLNSKYSLKV